MRISDWSSDVCSSDLWRTPAPAQRTGQHRERQDARAQAGEVAGPPGLIQVAEKQDDAGGNRKADPDLEVAQQPEHRQDRKSVGEGKSGSVRVVLGGRRIIKKKNKNKLIKSRSH